MMWTSHDTVGFVFLAGVCVQIGFSFEGRFTDLPSNMTVKEGQNIEMACAFQSGTASVYLEIQWWFVKEPEPTESEEAVDAEENISRLLWRQWVITLYGILAAVQNKATLGTLVPEKMEMIPEPDPDDEGTKISTVKVQGNDISHKLQISRVGKSDEGLYECRVTRANYGEIVEYKAQAWLKVNATARPRRPLLPPKKSSPLHLTDKKPRKSNSPLGQDSMSSDQRVASTSTSHTSSNTAKHNPSSGTRISSTYGLAVLLACGLVRDALL
ncbi:V-set and transmembrane domain-containing protein 2A isoform X1 [Etheostoma cragini]|uniref:V-set and transmembrane domain-containing protein 2A isoform X1 n=1 Tax=Etheostoma cragini TaxID=417921 RepID=UPI00155ECB67|nr:V-set and transmembrane domain-containing protein 2A isoform X1 [Etheostoma cragini]